MFKRVDRRRKRKEKEERLGLDEDQLGVFGLHHTDSSESESDSSDSASTSSSDGLTTQPRKKRKREASSPSYDEDGEGGDGESATDDEEGEGNSDDSEGSHPPLTIASALNEPIRPDSDSEAWVCVFCPGKTLKHATMVKVHEASRIHQRRSKRMQQLSMKFSPDEDIQNVLAKSATHAQPKVGNETLSFRAQKRMAKQAKLKERRKKIKEKKAIAIASAKATKAVVAEPKAGDTSDIDEENYTLKRPKVVSRDSPGAKNVHQTSVQVQAKGKRTPTDASRDSRKAPTKAPVSEKSKRGGRMGEQSTPAH